MRAKAFPLISGRCSNAGEADFLERKWHGLALPAVPHQEKCAKSLVALMMWSVVLLACATVANAAGPRWVSGPPFFWPQGVALAWYTNHPTYFTDPGDLSASVNHAAADALVARAAAVWTVPTASLVLAKGGSLDEHVTGAGITMAGSTMPVLPADVQSANYRAKNIAILYDTDGSVIDALLGAGGSDPSGCLQTGVVESVDSFGANSTIQHALLLLNGRCTGPEPEKQLQMQYQLERAFGRVLGLGWSQTNDNVFTSVPVPTRNDALNWPIMHPIDIICGPYTYQCLPQPFTLRADDLSSLSQLYFIYQGQGAGMAGKQDSLSNASTVDGFVRFPNGQGMEGVNVTVRRRPYFSATVEEWQTVSAVSGFRFRQTTGTPITAQDGSAAQSIGMYDGGLEGYWQMSQVPLPAADPWQTVVVTTEPINPLYTGPYALSTMAVGSLTMAPSGSAMQAETDIVSRFYYWPRVEMTAHDAVSDCTAGADGTESAPAAMSQTGWWTGALCGYAHTAWTNVTVKANRSLTMEVTAVDETGSASMMKAMPMVGVWWGTDATGVAPTIAATPVAFNSFGVGLSTVTMGGTGSPAGNLRMAIADYRGAGRPDFGYQARVLYADAIQPANVGANGGTVVISGTGFRQGNVVTVNGAMATVTAVTATSITAVVPSLRAIGSNKATLATVAVRDVTTNGVTTMTSALGYGSVQERMQMVSAPAGPVVQGKTAATAFAVQVLAADGVTPVANETVTFAVTTGYATFGTCGAVSCAVKTDAQGVASTMVTPTTVGTVTMQASTSLLSVPASFLVVSVPDALTLVSAPTGMVTVGAPATTVFSVRVVAGDGMTARPGQTVTVMVANGTARLEACGAATCNLRTDATGTVVTAVTPLVSGAISVTATSAAGTVTASFRAAGETMSLVSAPTDLVAVGSAAGLAAGPDAGSVGETVFAVKVVSGDGVSPVAGEAVLMSAIGGGVRFAACGGTTCTLMTNAQGIAASAVAATVGGAIVLTAAAPSGSVTAGFTARAETMSVVSRPTGSVMVGTVATTSFAVRLTAADGVSPVMGETVQFRTTAGSARLGGCGSAGCAMATDAQGVATMTVTPTAAGTVVVTANSVTGSATAAVIGTVLPDVLQVVEGLAGTVYVGDTVSPGFSVRLVLADGKTPIAGQAVTINVSAGAATLGACGGTSCTVVTDANGIASTGVTPTAAGALAVTAQAVGVTGALAQTATMTVLARQRAVAAIEPVVYVAEGVTVNWTAQVVLSDTSAATDGLPVLWTASAGMQFVAGSSMVSGSVAGIGVQVSGLGAGDRVQGTACAWSGVCGTLTVVGVSAAEWQVQAVSGGGQQVAAGGVTEPVVMRVTDAAGHAVMGASVAVYQTVTAWQQACVDQGRCPAGAVMGSTTTRVVSDVAGLVTLQNGDVLAAVGEQGSAVQITAAAGTQGTASVMVERLP